MIKEPEFPINKFYHRYGISIAEHYVWVIPGRNYIKNKDHWINHDVGIKYWFNSDNQFHRIDGPAFEDLLVSRQRTLTRWYLEGQEYTLNDWLIRTTLSNEGKVMLKLRYG